MSDHIVAVTAEHIGGLRRLEPLARRIFGEGDRAPGWFDRKLARECVDPSASWILTERPDAPTDASAWCGYALVGVPPSLQGGARTAGIGVLPRLRGKGLGGQLLESVFEGCRQRGIARVRTDAALEAVPFYERYGYRCERAISTWLAFGEAPAGSGDRSPEPATFAPTADPVVLAAWLAEGWERAPVDERSWVKWRTPGGTVEAWLCREGSALACHRLQSQPGTTASTWLASLREFRGTASPQTPLLLLGVDPYGALAAALATSAWSEVQRLALCVRSLESPFG